MILRAGSVFFLFFFLFVANGQEKNLDDPMNALLFFSEISQKMNTIKKIKTNTNTRESAVDFLHLLLPVTSKNRLWFEQYLLEHEIHQAPRQLTISDNSGLNKSGLFITWDLGERDKDLLAKEYVEFLQIENEQKGYFKLNGVPFVFTPLGDMQTNLFQIENSLSLSLQNELRTKKWSSSWFYGPLLLSPRWMRSAPWPRERAGIFILAMLYGFYFSHSSHRCQMVENSLSQIISARKWDLLDISKCEKERVEVEVKSTDEDNIFWKLSWSRLLPEQISLSARSFSDKKKMYSTTYIYQWNDWGLKKVVTNESEPVERQHDVQQGSHLPSSINSKMLMDFRHYYELLEKLRNAGQEWGYSCMSSCRSHLMEVFVLSGKKNHIARDEEERKRKKEKNPKMIGRKPANR